MKTATRNPEQKSALKVWLFRLLVPPLTLVLCLPAMEVAVRVLRPQPLSIGRYYAPDPDLGYGLLPGFQGKVATGEYDSRIHINEMGLRGAPVRPREPGRKSVLVLGDSFTFGVGVSNPETFPALLETRLSASGFPCRVHNAAVPGHGPVQYLRRYNQLRSVLRPDRVVVGMYIGNDIFDCVWKKEGTRFRVVDGWVVSGDVYRLDRCKTWIRTHSHLYRLASRIQQKILLGNQSHEGRFNHLTDQLLSQGDWSQEPFLAEAWKTLRASLTDLRRRVAEDGAMLLVVLLPLECQVSDSLWAARVEGRLGRFGPQERLCSLLEEMGLACLDLVPAFLKHPGEDLFYARDGHWTPAGHRVVAEAVARAVQGGSASLLHTD